MIGNVPDGWRVEKLSNEGQFIRGVSYSKDDLLSELSDDSITLLRANNIQETLYLDDVQYLKKQSVKDVQLLTYGDILLSTSSGSKHLVGKNIFINKNLSNYSFGAFCSVYRSNNISKSKYISKFFKSTYFKNSLSLNGNNINNLRTNDLANIKIPIPPLPQQEKIVKVLDITSDLIEKQKELIEKYDLLLKSRFIEMFGDPIKNPMGWEVVLIEQVVKDFQNGLYKPSSEYNNEGTPILRIDNFYDGKIKDINKLKRLNVSEKEKTHYALKNGNIVINRVNSIEYLGKNAYITKLQEDTVFESNMIRLIIDIDIVHPVFLSKILTTDFIYQQILQRAKKAVNQASINQQDVKSFNIYLPPIKLQNKFASIVEKIEIIKEQENKKLEHLETLHNSLMDKAFKGEIG